MKGVLVRIGSILSIRIFSIQKVSLSSQKDGSPRSPFVSYPQALALSLIVSCILSPAGEARERAAKPQPSAMKQGVQFHKGPDQIEIRVGGNPFTSYHFQGYNKPIFFPLRTASGKVVTRGWPMIPDLQGEVHDHPHHKGLWLTHGSVNGVDFWSEGGKTGKIVHREFLVTQEGQQVGILKSLNDWISPTGQKILEELREVRIYFRPGIRILDFDFQLTAVNDPVVFGDTKEGSFGIRLSHPFREESGGRIENSVGGVGETQCWGKQADWVDFTAQIQGERVGVAILNHPASFRFPTYWHVRGYTLFAANPFGWHDFLNDPSKDGSYRLAAGQSIILRYRVTIHSGSTKEGAIADQFKEYVRDVK
jgi:hypothetical protein